MMFFDTLKSRYKLSGVLHLKSGLHIGSGGAREGSGPDNPVMRDYEGYPFIPGSSLKGALRAAIEQVSRNFNKDDRLICCNIFGSSTGGSDGPCIDEYKKDEIKESSADTSDYEQTIWDESCMICRLFGSPWLASKVWIQDLYIAREKFDPILVEVRDGVAIERDTETARDKGKFDFEVVPPGTEFELEIVLENPEDFEIALINLGIRQFNEGFARLGGIISRGLGRVSIEWSHIRKYTPQNILYDPEIVDIEKFIALGKEALQNKLSVNGGEKDA